MTQNEDTNEALELRVRPNQFARMHPLGVGQVPACGLQRRSSVEYISEHPQCRKVTSTFHKQLREFLGAALRHCLRGEVLRTLQYFLSVVCSCVGVFALIWYLHALRPGASADYSGIPKGIARHTPSFCTLVLVWMTSDSCQTRLACERLVNRQIKYRKPRRIR